MRRPMPRNPPQASHLVRALAFDRRGAVSAEYLVATAIGFFVIVGLAALGASMVDGYGASLQILYSDTP